MPHDATSLTCITLPSLECWEKLGGGNRLSRSFQAPPMQPHALLLPYILVCNVKRLARNPPSNGDHQALKHLMAKLWQ
jgi:hypothetical protein